VPVRPALLVDSRTYVRLDLNELNESQFRQGPDGWHAVLYLRNVEHRIWFKEAPIVSATYTVELPLDRDFEFRADAGRRLWLGLNGRPQGAPLHAISPHRRRRIALALRASDAQTDGATYYEIAEVLLPAQRIPKRDWGTHEVRDRIKRLVKTGFALVQGGYRALLTPPSRKK
jgi:T6SS, Transcription factor, DNA binding domain